MYNVCTSSALRSIVCLQCQPSRSVPGSVKLLLAGLDGRDPAASLSALPTRSRLPPLPATLLGSPVEGPLERLPVPDAEAAVPLLGVLAGLWPLEEWMGPDDGGLLLDADAAAWVNEPLGLLLGRKKVLDL